MTATPGPAPAPGADAPSSPSSRPSSWIDLLLRVPLVVKIAGANALIGSVALGVILIERESVPVSGVALSILVGALVLGLVVSVALAALALRPLRDLERAALRYQGGDIAARVPPSRLADDDMRRVATSLNTLFEGLSRDRERLRQLAERVVTQSDEERARLARDLYDSTAQSIAALMLELSVASSATQDHAAQVRLERARRIAADVLEEIRALSHAAHPRLLDDRGLSVALVQLVREFNQLGHARVAFDRTGNIDAVDASISSVVYRVARVALRSAVLVRQATTVQVRTQAQDDALVLEVEDDGRAAAGREDDAIALDAVRHRIELMGGTFEQHRQGGQERVLLRVPHLAARGSASDDRSGSPNDSQAWREP